MIDIDFKDYEENNTTIGPILGLELTQLSVEICFSSWTVAEHYLKEDRKDL